LVIAETVALATPVTPRYRAREAGKLRFMRSNRQLAGVDLKALPRAEPRVPVEIADAGVAQCRQIVGRQEMRMCIDTVRHRRFPGAWRAPHASVIRIADGRRALECGHVRYGPLADIIQRQRHVRFTPDSGHSLVRVDV